MISSLQVVLAVVGVVFVALVVGYNLWQERKFRREANRLFSSKREDILLGESVATDNGEGIAVPDDVAHDDDAGWRMQQATRGEWQGEEAEAAEQESEAMPIRVEEVPIRETDDSLRMPTHAEAASVARAEAPRPEPVREPPPAPIPQPAAPEAAPEPEAEPAPEPPPEPAVTAKAPPAEAPPFQAESGLDKEIEYLARLRFSHPVSASYASLFDGLRRVGKPIRVMGKRLGGGWEHVGAHSPGQFEALELGILLADRSGALDSEQLERFCRVLYDFAAARGGAVSCPDKQAALKKARELDMFCMNVDMLIGLNVVSPDLQPFKAADIHLILADEGLTVGRDGVYYLKDKKGHVLFSLTNQESHPFREGGGDFLTHGVTLLFDVPRVADGLQVFDNMTRLGQRMAYALGGSLVDDNGRNVSEDSLQKDRNRLVDYYQRMQQRGIPAGSERALRLFA